MGTGRALVAFGVLGTTVALVVVVVVDIGREVIRAGGLELGNTVLLGVSREEAGPSIRASFVRERDRDLDRKL